MADKSAYVSLPRPSGGQPNNRDGSKMIDKSAYVSLPLPSGKQQNNRSGNQPTFAGQQFKPVQPLSTGGGVQERYCGGVMEDYFTPRAPVNNQHAAPAKPVVTKQRMDQSCYLAPK
jgi:hypothetical protein